MPEFSAHDVHRHRRRRRTRQRLRQRLRPVLRLPLRSRDGSVPLDRSNTSESDSHSISLKIRTHGTVPRAVHNSRGTSGDQDGHLLVQHVPRPLRARPVRGHNDRLRREGLEDVSGKKSIKVGREEIDPISYHYQFHLSFQIYSSVPIFLLLLLYFITPESPRWLIANKRYGEARVIVTKAAKINRKHVPEEVLKMPGMNAK